LKLKLIAVNHWSVAIETHKRNHPEADQHCANLDTVDPLKLVPGGKLDLLVASPECVHHSKARGGRPVNDQSRANPWRVTEWCSKLRVRELMIENVPEISEWGPIGSNGKPIKRLKGKTFLAWVASLESLGYKVEWRILNCADYGDATSRPRFFLRAKLGHGQIEWPKATHAPAESLDNRRRELFHIGGRKRPHRPAAEIIDWSLPGESIFTRRRPLRPNTIEKIFKGLQKFSGLPFIIGAGGPEYAGKPRPVDIPLNTVLTDDHRALCQPIIIPINHGKGDCRSYGLDRPLPTITSFDAWAIAQPYLVKYYGGHDAESIHRPLGTITANYEHFGLCQPYLVLLRNNSAGQTLQKPLTTITTKGAHHGVTVPFLIKYNGTGGARPVDKPVDTITSKDRFGLVQPVLNIEGEHYLLDTLFRMLQPHELAGAHSFPKDYWFAGTREQKVKQIGNAVPVRTGRALCYSILRGFRQPRTKVPSNRQRGVDRDSQATL
jgi:DNA (cytosine-5)-methyltransferase 1